MAGKIVYKRTNLEDVLVLYYIEENFTQKFIIDADMYNKFPSLRWHYQRQTLVTRKTAPIAKLVLLGNTIPLGNNRFIRYKNGNKFDVRRANLELVYKNIFVLDETDNTKTHMYITSSINQSIPHKVTVDTQFIDYIKPHLWHVCNGDGYVQTRVRTDLGLVIVRLHHMIIELREERDLSLNTDHIDRNKLNNCIHNLRQVTRQVNSSNCNYNRDKDIIIGVRKHHGSWMARSQCPKNPGKSRRVYFSISEYGEEEAKRLAIAKRKQWEEELGITSTSI